MHSLVVVVSFIFFLSFRRPQVGSELIFEEELLPPLVSVMRCLTDRNPRAVLLMSFQERGIITEDEVVEALSPLFELKMVGLLVWLVGLVGRSVGLVGVGGCRCVSWCTDGWV